MSEVQHTVRDAINRLKTVNALGKTNLSNKGVDLPADEPTTTDVVDGIEDIPTGASLNIEYGNTAPIDTTKLWIKSAEPENVTVDYDIDNGVESIQQITSATLPTSTFLCSCGVVGTKCYVFGGHNGLNTINIYDTVTGIRTLSNTSLPYYAYDMACGVVGKKIYLFGGYNNTSPWRLDTITVYDTETDTIQTLQGANQKFPSGMDAMACGVVGTKCYLFGGVNSSGSGSTNIFVFDTETEELTRLSVNTPYSVYRNACAVVGTKCYLFGKSRSTNIMVFDTETLLTEQLSITTPQGGEGIACGVVGTKCYLFGGYNGNTYYKTISVFDSVTGSISVLSDVELPVGAYGIACGVIGNNCYLFGGNPSGTAIQKFTITFPLNENDIYIQEDTLKNQFTLISEPTKVVTGVSNVYVGNSNNEAEKCEAYLHDGIDWQEI